MDDPVSAAEEKTGRKTVNVAAAVIVKDGRVFATQRGYGPYKDWWEFPGGKIETGETPEDALRREIREELDTEILVGELLEEVEYDYPEFHLSMKCYMAEVLSGSLVLREHEAARWLPAEELDAVRWLPADLAVTARLRGLMET
ncbi:MAG: (deoxy)nucleoside triphosphate pyrophosphohydrolase [Oscillospiraceae bacterium]|nr:(deoxy)nucleoside triphosphate pyrophosphohydrolase [Oscillospiraceae bacterium]